MRYFYLIKEFAFGHPDDPPGTSPPISPPPSPPGPPPPPPVPKTFSQVDVDRMMAEHRTALKKQNEELVTQLEDLKKNTKLTVEEKQALEDRIQVLSQQHLTDNQQLKAKVDSWEKKYKADTEELGTKAKAWQDRFQMQLMTQEIVAGSVKHKAYSPDQMVTLLSKEAKVVEDLDSEGKPTGKYKVVTPFSTLDAKTHQPVVLELPIQEAIGEMRKQPEKYGNLFLAEGGTGLGLTGNNGSADTGQFDPNVSAAEFRKQRKAVAQQ